jgi:hypothetical protein
MGMKRNEKRQSQHFDRINRIDRIMSCWSVGGLEYWSNEESNFKGTISRPLA